MTIIVALTLVTTTTLLAGIGGNKALYVGGTVAGLVEKTEGKLDTANDTMLTFTPDKKKLTAATIPYKSITELEYGQKAGRRVGVAVRRDVGIRARSVPQEHQIQCGRLRGLFELRERQETLSAEREHSLGLSRWKLAVK